MSDKAIRRLTAATVLLVALIAAIVSFEHLYHLSVTHGEPRLDGALIPVATDGTVVAASLVMLRAARLGLPTPWLARLMLVASVATTLAANMAFGWSWSVWGIILAGAPVVWFIGNAESVIAFGRKTRQPAPVPASAGAPVKPPLPKQREVQDGRYSGVSCAQPTTGKIQAALRTRDRQWAQAIDRSRGAVSAPPPPPAAAPAGALPRVPAGASNGRAHA